MEIDKCTGRFTPKDFTGYRQGKITFIEKTQRRENGGSYFWKCRCDCGNFIEITSRRLINKPAIQNCGCEKIKNTGQFKIKDLTNIRSGKLICINNTFKIDKYGYYLWNCKCDCGNEKQVSSQKILKKVTKSCGCLKKGRAATYENSIENSIYCGRKASAKRGNKEWNLTREFYHKISNENCHYCNSPPKNIAKFKQCFIKQQIYGGIDRIDSNIGYIPENCLPCCYDCNKAKSTMSYEEFLNWIKKVYNNLNK